MQQSPQMLNGAPSIPPTINVTTEQIQKYLDENKDLILAIIENQNQGKFAECAPYQAQLQQNLTFLARIADAQPQAPTMLSQMPSQPAAQQGLVMQRPQAPMSQQQQGPFMPKLPFQLNDQQLKKQSVYLQQQQHLKGQMGVRPGGTSDMYHATHSGLGNTSFGIPGSKQDSSEASAGDFLGKLGSRYNSTEQ